MSQRNTLKRRVPSTGGIDLNNQATRMTEPAPLLFRIEQTSWRIHPWISWVGGKEVSKTISRRYSKTASMHGTSSQHMMRTPKLQKRKRKTMAEHKPMYEDPSVFSSLGIWYNGSSITQGEIQAMCQSFNSTTCKDFEPSSCQPPFQRDQFFNRGSAPHKPSSPQKKHPLPSTPLWLLASSWSSYMPP